MGEVSRELSAGVAPRRTGGLPLQWPLDWDDARSGRGLHDIALVGGCRLALPPEAHAQRHPIGEERRAVNAEKLWWRLRLGWIPLRREPASGEGLLVHRPDRPWCA